MWRRVSSLTQFVSPTKSSSILNQPAYILKIWESFTTQIPNSSYTLGEVAILIVQQGGEKGGTSFKDRIPFITFVLGGPGSGKGTQCEKIVETFGFKHLSAGDLLRQEIASKSEYGSMILNTIKDGRIVPSEVTVKLIQKEMESSDNKKFLIDGFPRCEENRIAFEQIIGAEPNIVLFFDCPVEEMVKRVLNRNQGRVDDNMETIKKRLKVFEALNLPVVNYYAEKGKLHKICALGTEDEIFEQVWPVFAACKQVIQ